MLRGSNDIHFPHNQRTHSFISEINDIQTHWLFIFIQGSLKENRTLSHFQRIQVLKLEDCLHRLEKDIIWIGILKSFTP